MNDIRQKNLSLFKKWAPCYDFAPFRWWMRKFQVPVLKELAGKIPDIAILDVSCGTGELLLALAQQGKRQLYGIDISPEMLKVARKKLPTAVQLQQGEAERLPFPEGKFDYVISTEAFHHYPDQKKALQEMERVTKKGGKVILVDINFFWPLVHRLFEIAEPGCVKINNKEEIRLLFENVGWGNVEQQRNAFFSVMTRGTKEAKNG